MPLIATAFTSCSNEELNNPDGCAPMTVNVTNNIPSRATADIVEETTLPAGAQIGVSVLTEDGAAYGTGYANVLYSTTNGTSWATTNEPQLSATPAKAVAYYPYAEGTAYDNITVTTDAQTDVMYSEWVTGLSNVNANATFQMKHALAAVRLVVKQDGNFPADTKLTSVTLESDAFIASAKLNAATGALTGHTGTATLSHEPDVALTTAGTTLDFITVPGTEAKAITFTATIGEKQYTASTTPANTLAQGKIHTYTLTITSEEMVLSSVKVEEWKTGLSADKIFSKTEKITFSIQGKTYEAIPGMTWGVWLMSSFNTDGFYADNEIYNDLGYPVKNIGCGDKIIAGSTYNIDAPEFEFTINGVTFYAMNGMTWGEWVQSSYNNNTLGQKLLIVNNGYVYHAFYGYPLEMNGILIKSSSLIYENANYVTTTPGSGGSDN